MVSKKDAYNAFVYHGERIYTPTGKKDPYHELMRKAWAYVYDSGCYKNIKGKDPVEWDKQALEIFRKKKCG